MGLNLIKTTVEIDPDVYLAAKLKAVAERKTLKEVINKSLRDYVVKRKTLKKNKVIKIGGYSLGGIKGTLSRSVIYEDF